MAFSQRLIVPLCLMLVWMGCQFPVGPKSTSGLTITFALSQPGARSFDSARLLLSAARTLEITLTRDSQAVDTKTLTIQNGTATYAYTTKFEVRVPHVITARALNAAGAPVFQGSATLILYEDRDMTLYLLPVRPDGTAWTTIAASAQPASGIFPAQAVPSTGTSMTYLVDFGSTGTSFTFDSHAGLDLYLQRLDGTRVDPVPSTVTPADVGQAAFWATYEATATGTVGSVGSFVIPLTTLGLPATYEMGQTAVADLGALLVKTPANATNSAVQWTVADPTVATVDPNGVVTAVATTTPASTTVTVASVADPTITMSLPLQVFGPEFSRLSALAIQIDAVAVPFPFVPATFSYPLGPTSSSTIAQTLTLTPSEGYPGQTLSWSVNGITWSPLVSGSPSNVPLVQGANDIRVKVLAKNGSDTNVYHLLVTKTVLPASYTLTPPTLTITTATAGAQFTANVTPSVADNPAVTWSSSNTAVALVNPTTGVITPVTGGAATVTARSVADPTITATGALTVEQVSAVTLNLSVPTPGTLSLSPGAWSIPRTTRLVFGITGTLATAGTGWVWTAGGVVLGFTQTGTTFDLDTASLTPGTYDLTVEVTGPDTVFYSGSAQLQVSP